MKKLRIIMEIIIFSIMTIGVYEECGIYTAIFAIGISSYCIIDSHVINILQKKVDVLQKYVETIASEFGL